MGQRKKEKNARAAGRYAGRPSADLGLNLKTRGENFYHDPTKLKRLRMYKEGRPTRDPDGRIIKPGSFQSKLPSGSVARVQPDKRWFGNTRTIGQKELAQFREELGNKMNDPYQVLLRANKLPMSLLTDTTKVSRMNMLESDSFQNTFGPKALRKKPKLMLSSLTEMAEAAENSLALVGHLLDVIKASAPARIVVLSSMAHNNGKIKFDDLNFEKDYHPVVSYAQSKLANVLFANELNRKLKGTGVVVNSVHPGGVRTEIIRHIEGGFITNLIYQLSKPFLYLLLKSPQEGAQTQIYVSVAPDKEASEIGGFYFADCQVFKSPNPSVGNVEIEKRLWSVSEKLVGFSY